MDDAKLNNLLVNAQYETIERLTDEIDTLSGVVEKQNHRIKDISSELDRIKINADLSRFGTKELLYELMRRLEEEDES